MLRLVLSLVMIAMIIISGDDIEEESMGYRTVTAEMAKEIMDSTTGYIILDVREADEYSQGHIKDAIRLSYTEINAKAEGVLQDKQQPVLVYCRSGRRSAIAAQSLADLGYTNVIDFGGIIDWPYETVQ